VTKDPREVGPLSRGVISPDDSTPIRPVTGRHSLLPSSFTRRPIGNHLAAGLPQGEDDGLTTFHGRITDGAGSASSPVAWTATAGDGRGPCTWPLTVWFKPISAFGLLDLTTFISSSPELALPSTLAPDRLGVSSRRIPSREVRPPQWGEVTLSQKLRTAGLLRPHVLVGYRWSHTGLCPKRSVITGPSVASCRTSHRSGLAQFRHPARHVVVPALKRFRPPDGDMLMRYEALAWFRKSSPQRGVPFSPRGPGGPVPPLRRYYGTLRLPSVPLAALRCLRLAIPPPRRAFAPFDRRRAVEGIGALVFRAPEPELSVETDGSPRFPGTPRVPWPCSPTPAGPSTPGHCGVLGVAPASDKDEGSHEELSGLNRTALALAVYASQ
jgi:hypothetical protein